MRLRSLVAVLALAAPTFTSVLATPVPACATEAGTHAALVVDTGQDVSTYCVSLGAPSVDGLDLIRLAGRQHGLAYSLGFGGQAVCSLAGVGVSGDDCFSEYPNFWGYWHGNGSGGWGWSGVGPASAQIGDGDVEGWVWGTGDSGASHRAPPGLAFDDVCEPSDGADGSGSGGGDQGGGGGSGDTGDAGADGGTPIASSSASPSPRERERPRDRARPTASASDAAPSDDVDIRAASSPPVDPSGGPPAALFLALAAATVLVGGGVRKLRVRPGAT
jgi:hypothetical protein